MLFASINPTRYPGGVAGRVVHGGPELPACSSFALRTKLQSPPAVALRPAAGTVCGPGPRARGPAGPRAACPARSATDSAMRRRYAGHGGRRRSRPGDHALGLPATRTSPPAPDYDTASPPRHTPAFHPSPPSGQFARSPLERASPCAVPRPGLLCADAAPVRNRFERS